MQHRVLGHGVIRQRDLEHDGVGVSRVLGDVAVSAGSLDVRRDDQAVPAAVDGRRCGGVGEADYGEAACERYVLDRRCVVDPPVKVRGDQTVARQIGLPQLGGYGARGARGGGLHQRVRELPAFEHGFLLRVDCDRGQIEGLGWRYVCCCCYCGAHSGRS